MTAATTSTLPDPGPGDPAEYRRVLGHVPTSVAVLTAAGISAPVGLTIGTLTSVSLDPPLIACFIDRGSRTWLRLFESDHFGVNVLGHNQRELCRAFSRRPEERFTDVAWSRSASGIPLLDDAIVTLECTRVKLDIIGDHYLVIGRVESLDLRSSEPPLIFLRGGFVDMAALQSAAETFGAS